MSNIVQAKYSQTVTLTVHVLVPIYIEFFLVPTHDKYPSLGTTTQHIHV